MLICSYIFPSSLFLAPIKRRIAADLVETFALQITPVWPAVEGIGGGKLLLTTGSGQWTVGV